MGNPNSQLWYYFEDSGEFWGTFLAASEDPEPTPGLCIFVMYLCLQIPVSEMRCDSIKKWSCDLKTEIYINLIFLDSVDLDFVLYLLQYVFFLRDSVKPQVPWLGSARNGQSEECCGQRIDVVVKPPALTSCMICLGCGGLTLRANKARALQ